MAFRPGDIVGGVYAVDTCGPTGGMSRIYRAWHRGLVTWHALKVLEPRWLADKDVRDRFLEEGRIQAQLRHPGVVRVTDVLYEDGLLALVMDWIDGEDLEALLQRERVAPLARAVPWMIQVLQALTAVHAAGVVHRDLKPANILIGVDGQARLTDFGIARHPDIRRTQHGQRMGTPAYMSPEQRVDAAAVDARSDLYAVGVVLAELLAGSADPKAIEKAGLPPDIVAVLRTALAADPADRFPDAAAFAAALDLSWRTPVTAVLDDLEIDPDRTKTVEDEPAPPRPRRGRWVLALLAGLALGAGGSLGAGWWMVADQDGDGIGRRHDRCLLQAEDRDGFQDGDGCPEPDNDKDGAGDETDRCPAQTEDADGFQDDDGCPDPDNDEDGVSDGVDACPLQPEDQDGAADADGCPEPDNDGDGVNDADDPCPDHGEPANGVMDDDGCPDPAVAVGDSHACALAYDGLVVCWGEDDSKQGGSRRGGYFALAAADDHTCGLDGKGDLRCWGRDAGGEAPQRLAGPFVALDTGSANTCLIGEGGAIRCLGAAGPIQAGAPGEGGFTAVTVGKRHACALGAEGAARCWGEGPAAAAPAGTFKAIAAGGWHTCAVTSAGALACWGEDTEGQLQFPEGKYSAVAAGEGHSCAARTDGAVRCWGRSLDGQAPPLLAGDFYQLDLGVAQGCGVRRSGALHCWGASAATPPHGRGLLAP